MPDTVMMVADSPEGIKRLSKEVAEMPDRVKLAAREGFQIASGLSDTDRQKVVELMSKSFESSNASLDTEIFSSEVPSLSRSDAGRLMTALSISFALLTQNVVTATEFIEAARANIFEADNEPTALAIADVIIGQRPVLSKAMAQSRLANAVLPSLSQFDVAVDLRIQFDNGKAEEFVAVAVIHFDTDINNNELCCQLSRADINMMLEKLQSAAKEMDLAVELLKQAISGEK